MSFAKRLSASASLGSVPLSGDHGSGLSPSSSTGSSPAANEGNVQVVLRIRPPNEHDNASIPARFQRTAITAAAPTTVAVDSGSTIGSTPKKPQQFHYDRVLGPSEGQKELYEAAAKGLVDKFMKGFNVTILAYGQTSSGKSYSMGTALDSSNSSSSTLEITPQTGLVPRAVAEIFRRCAEEERLAGGRANLQFEATNSFVELYNEDLLDLLSSSDPSIPASERPQLSIREDKDGHIIWSGLKEIKVASKEDVMANLRSGTALRRTNETDMNAQSSRSHAIFSLTLTQRKRVGGVAPPHSAGPGSSFPASASAPPSAFAAANGPAPSTPSAIPGSPARGIPRPSSVGPASRTMSPTPGSRPTTPSGLPMLRGPRPSSVLGSNGRSGTPVSRVEEQESASFVINGNGKKDVGGEWVTITSKFHFVDLAGSERLKRTSALGDRLKEGISINSGLLALGNVISALGDPAKARQSTHVPYRDSKLTRLLQDSLGGNAHTLMIACVSPAEYNLTETLSTIKYANRARNIKNRAEVNQQEAGWDDIQHLQAALTKLRKEHAVLKQAAASAGVVAGSPTTNDLSSIQEDPSSSAGGSSERTVGQLRSLQEQYESLAYRHDELLTQNARQSKELEMAKASGGAAGGESKGFAEMVGPVIAEYERAIAGLEAELKLARGTLAHTNSLYNEQEIQLSEVVARNAQTESYVSELRARVNQLAERESTTDAYIRDIESKLAAHTDRDGSRSGEVTDLRKEIARLKATDGNSNRYVADLEARMAKTDASKDALSAHVERLEKEVERREDMYRELEARLQLVDTTNDNRLLLKELDDKDDKVAALERKLEDAIREMDVIGKERTALLHQAKKTDGEREGLRDRLDEANASTSAAKRASMTRAIPPATRMTLQSQDSYMSQASTNEPFFTPATEMGQMDFDRDSNGNTSDGPSTPTPMATSFPMSSSERTLGPSEHVVAKMDAELRELQEAHTRTLGDLDEVSSKYRDALKEIADLAAQVQEARLLQSEAGDVMPHSPSAQPSPNRSESGGAMGEYFSSANGSGGESVSPTAIKLGSTPRRRLVTDSNGSSSKKRESAPPVATANGSSPPGQSQPGFGSRGGGLPRPLSLSQEFALSPSSRSSSGGQAASSATSLLNTSPTSRTQSIPLSKPERSVQSLENEIMSLQATLKLREKEIDQLERNVNLHVLPLRGSSLSLRSDGSRQHARNLSDASRSDGGKSVTTNGVAGSPHEEDGSPTDSNGNSHPSSPQPKIRRLSPSPSQALTGKRLSTISNQSEEEEEEETSPLSEGEDHSKRLEELMRSMAQKESAHRDAVETMKAEIDKVKRDHAGVVKLSRDQALNVSTELDGLRNQLLTAQDLHDDLSSQLDAIKRREQDLIASKQQLEETHVQEISKLRAEHEEVLSRRDAEAAAHLARRDAAHAEDLKRHELERGGVLTESQEEHAAAVASLSEQHSDRLLKLDAEHASDLAALLDQHTRATTAKDAEAASALDRLRSDHTAAFARLEQEKASESDRLKASLQKSREEHVTVLQQVRTEAETKRSVAEEQHAAALEQAKKGHDTSLGAVAAELAASTAALADAREAETSLRSEHERAVANKVADHEGVLSSLKASHQDALSRETGALLSAHQAGLAAEVEQRTLADEKVTEFANQNAQLQSELVSLRASQEVETTKLQQELASVLATVSQLQSTATEKDSQRGDLLAEIDSLRTELQRVQGEHLEVASTRDSVLHDLDSQRTSLTQAQTELFKSRSEVDALQSERAKQDAAMAELQAKLAEISATVPSPVEPPAGLTSFAAGPRESLRDINVRAGSPGPRSSKPPPPTPPPTAPVPPLPSSLPTLPAIPDDGTMSTLSRNSLQNGDRASSLSSGRRSPRSTVTSMDGGGGSSSMHMVADPRLVQQIEEQDGTIKTLGRRLQHCEADLQANIDLVNTLEAALNDSERALRKSRLSANDIAKDRDRLSAECDTLRSLLQHARAEALSLRSSQNDERGRMESQMESERRQKDTAKKELESRLEAMEKRKSKFNCF